MNRIKIPGEKLQVRHRLNMQEVIHGVHKPTVDMDVRQEICDMLAQELLKRGTVKCEETMAEYIYTAEVIVFTYDELHEFVSQIKQAGLHEFFDLVEKAQKHKENER